jgi:hypothetical protein
MRKRSLALIVLVLVCIPVFAGSYLTNDTGQTVYGLTVTFSEPVTITSFGDELTEVNPTGKATEFTFSSGHVSTSGGQWFNWKPAEAKLVSHEWLLSDLIPASRSSETIEHLGTGLPRSVTTHFAVASATKDVAKLPPLEFFTTPASSHSSPDCLLMQPIDGFTAGSDVPLDWWYSFSGNASNPTFTSLTPTGGSDVIYRYPEDGNIGHCTLRYKEPIDLSMCDGIKIIASSDHPVDVYVSMNICDAAVHPEPDEDYSCGQSSVTYPMPIHVTEESQVFILPFSELEISEWLLNSDAPVTMTPQFYGVTEISFNPDDEEGVLEIHKVSSVTQTIPVQLKGPKINDYYFQHPACVMQGVNDLDAIYALPLEGIPELGTGYAAIDPDSEKLTWQVETSNPGIGCGFQEDIFYIWGADPDWSGYGDVTLKVTDETGASDSITIPVTVFKRDKTLINKEGKKDYFVPWSPQLDINRILSVEEFLEEEGYKEENLDPRINWSKYVLLEFMKSVTFTGNWITENTYGPNWTKEATKMRIDYMLDELISDGVEWIFYRNKIFMEHIDSDRLIEIFDNSSSLNSGTPFVSTPEWGLKYLVNQAHNKGLKVAFGPFLQDITFGRHQIHPKSWEDWFESYDEFSKKYAGLAQSLGADHYVVGENLVNFSNNISTLRWGNEFSKIISDVRNLYSGSLSYLDIFYGSMTGRYNLSDWDRIPIFDKVDIISSNSLWKGMITNPHPTLNSIIDVLPYFIDNYLTPLVDRFDKPLIFFENGVPSQKNILYNFVDFAGKDYSASPDMEEQALWYKALFTVMQNYDWFYGYGWFGISLTDIGGINTKSLTFRNKPAELIIKSIYSDNQINPRSILIDGKMDDWLTKDIIYSDNVGDSNDFDCDLYNVYSSRDDLYTYLMIEIIGQLKPSSDIISIQIDCDGDNIADIPLGVVYYSNHWNAILNDAGMNFKKIIGILDVESNAQNNKFEIRIPNRLLDFPYGEMKINVSLIDNDRHFFYDGTDNFSRIYH